MRLRMWFVCAAACHFTAVGASSMRSAKVEFRAKGGEILHQIQFRFAVAGMPA